MIRVVLALGCAAALLAAGVARAEVRLDSRSAGPGPALQVLPASSGLWTPIGPIDDALLNPTGDLTGDGAPAWAAWASGLDVAWVRGGADVVVVSTADRRGWIARQELAAENALGTPIVASWRRGLLIAWRSLNPTGGEEVRLSWITRDERGGLIERDRLRFDGLLVGTLQQDDTLHVLLLDGGALKDVVLRIPTPPIDVLDRWEVPVDVLLTGRTTALVTPQWLQRLGLALHDDPRGAALSWWSAPRELSFVELDENGPALPVERLTAERGPERPEKLVREAIRIVRERH